MKGDGTKGVVISGHFMHEGNGLYAMNNDQKYEIIGSCIDSQESGSIDAAFCELDFSVCDVAQSPISDFPLDLNPIRSPPVGASVTKYTYTGISSGKITSTNVSARFKNGVVITNMLSADYKSQSGDSGGPIYSAAKKNNQMMVLLVGIHQGSSSTSNNAYIIQAQYINKTFGLSCY